jgi:hypothetical protein
MTPRPSTGDGSDARESAELAVVQALPTLLAASDILPRLNPREIVTPAEEFGDELLVVRFNEITAGVGATRPRGRDHSSSMRSSSRRRRNGHTVG